MGKTAAWIGAIFGSVGLVFAAVACWLYLADRSVAAGGVHPQGTLVEMVGSRDSDGSYSSRPVVEFVAADGTRHRFASSVSTSPPAYSVGQRVDVIYPPGAPEDAILDGFVDRFLLPLIFGGIGTLFAAIGGGLVFAWLRRRRIVARLRASGLPIQARFVECYRDTSVKLNGRSPFRVVCEAVHPGTGKLHSFRSDPIWVDLSERLAGREVRVFVDPARPRQHAVDLSAQLDESAMA